MDTSELKKIQRLTRNLHEGYLKLLPFIEEMGNLSEVVEHLGVELIEDAVVEGVPADKLIRCVALATNLRDITEQFIELPKVLENLRDNLEQPPNEGVEFNSIEPYNVRIRFRYPG